MKLEHEIIHTESSIIKALRQQFNNGYTYRIENIYLFADDWESDFFCVNRQGYSFEFEVKISRSDFKADFTKKRHSIIKNGGYTRRWTQGGIEHSQFVEHKFIPNRLYYAVPDGMISADELPDYAGLIYVNSHATVIKRAPFIHKNTMDFRKKLCHKMYHRWIEQRRENQLLLNRIKNLESKYGA